MCHFRVLSLLCCCAALSGAPVLAEANQTDAQKERQQQVQDCTADVLSLCALDMPDEKKIEACLRANIRDVSPTCRAWLR